MLSCLLLLGAENQAVVSVTVLTDLPISPFFHSVQDQFFSYMMAEAQKKEYRDIIENKGKFLLVHAPSGHKYVCERWRQRSCV